MAHPVMSRTEVCTLVWDLAEPLAEHMGLLLVDVTYTGHTLRVTLDRAGGGVRLQEVEAFHRALEPSLDNLDPIPASYTLEVSSPGAERPLRTERDYRIFAGRSVRIQMTEVVEGRRVWEGQLVGLVDGVVWLVAEGGTVGVALKDISSTRLN